jgi:hypothetical protein
MASSFRAGGGRQPCHAIEAEQWLSDPGFFSDFGGLTPNLVFSNARHFQFTSPIATPWAQNNRVRGKLFRAGAHWKGRPSVILLHGWSAELQYRWQFLVLARQLARAGVNAAMFELPYHCHRKPQEPGAIQNFISHDLLHMLEATRQSLADARALEAWLRAQGSPSVGLWGVSLGAWLAGLLICNQSGAGFPPARPHSSSEVPGAPVPAGRVETRPTRQTGSNSRPDFAVLLTPIARVDQAIEELAFCRAIRDTLQTTSVRLDPLNLTSHRPSISPRNILLVESQYDAFAPVETIESLWLAWGTPEIWRLPHGHISVLLSPSILGRVIRWLREKAYAVLKCDEALKHGTVELLNRDGPSRDF